MSSTIISLRRRGERADELLSHLDERLAEEYGDAYLGIRPTGDEAGSLALQLRPGVERASAERRVRAFLAEVAVEWDEHVELA